MLADSKTHYPEPLNKSDRPIPSTSYNSIIISVVQIWKLKLREDKSVSSSQALSTDPQLLLHSGAHLHLLLFSKLRKAKEQTPRYGLNGWMTRDFSRQAGCLSRVSQEEGWIKTGFQAKALEEHSRNDVTCRLFWGHQKQRECLWLVSSEP